MIQINSCGGWQRCQMPPLHNTAWNAKYPLQNIQGLAHLLDPGERMACQPWVPAQFRPFLPIIDLLRAGLRPFQTSFYQGCVSGAVPYLFGPIGAGAVTNATAPVPKQAYKIQFYMTVSTVYYLAYCGVGGIDCCSASVGTSHPSLTAQICHEIAH